MTPGWQAGEVVRRQSLCSDGNSMLQYRRGQPDFDCCAFVMGDP